MFFDILFKVLIFATDSTKDLTVSHVDVYSFGADKVEFLLDVHDWEGDVVVVDAVFDMVINLESLSWLEYNRRRSKQLFDLAIHFVLWDIERLPLLLEE